MMLPRYSSQQLLSSPTPTTLLKVTSIYSFQRFITHSIKISEFLLVRTNSKIFPQYSHRKPHPVVYTQMDARTSGRGWSKSLDAVITHLSTHSMQKESPSSTNWQDFLFIGDYSSIFSHLWSLYAAINHRSWSSSRSTITSHGNPLSRNFLSAREAWALSLSFSLFIYLAWRRKQVRAACACGWAITPFPSPSTPTRSDNIIIGFNLR